MARDDLIHQSFSAYSPDGSSTAPVTCPRNSRNVYPWCVQRATTVSSWRKYAIEHGNFG